MKYQKILIPMKRMFEKKMYAGWGDMDFNSHMRNTAYLDKSGDVRMMFFSENGFTGKEMARLRIGPVILKDEVEYYREVNLLEDIRVTLSIVGLSLDGSRFCIRNEFFLENGKLASRVTSTGGWMDLNTRKLTTPPEKLHLIIKSLVKTEDYQELPSSIKL
jgi:acyl-CoA thioester hydrolase